MKIKVAFLETDELYLQRLIAGLNSKYFDRLTIFSFNSIDVAKETMINSKFDAIIASDEFDLSDFDGHCAIAYFADSNDISTLKEVKAIGKYQKVDIIYKQILDLYSDVNKDVQLRVNTDTEDGAKVIGFFASSGGAGATSVSSAFAMRLAAANEKVLYLNLEKNGCDLVFDSDGTLSMADVIYALKSKNSNLSLKLESCVKQDQSGVYFYSVCNNVFDFLELSETEIIELIQTLKALGKYTYIIVDFHFDFNDLSFELLNLMYKYMAVTAGNQVSVNKLKKLYQAIKLNDQNKNLLNKEKMYVLYNKFVNETSITANDLDIKVAGGIPNLNVGTYKDTVEKIMSLQLFSSTSFN